MANAIRITLKKETLNEFARSNRAIQVKAWVWSSGKTSSNNLYDSRCQFWGIFQWVGRRTLNPLIYVQVIFPQPLYGDKTMHILAWLVIIWLVGTLLAYFGSAIIGAKFSKAENMDHEMYVSTSFLWPLILITIPVVAFAAGCYWLTDKIMNFIYNTCKLSVIFEAISKAIDIVNYRLIRLHFDISKYFNVKFGVAVMNSILIILLVGLLVFNIKDINCLVDWICYHFHSKFNLLSFR